VDVSQTEGNLTIDVALASTRERYVKSNPKSKAAHEKAKKVFPGGNTRSVLHFDPFPLSMERGEGAELWDIDGHRYSDFVGEFSAGLYGHTNPTIQAAIVEALESGVVLAAPTSLEEKLASALTARIPSLQRLRFCNSGTEANSLAIVTAIAVTGRSKILAFREAYHGGVLVFSGGGSPTNVPFDVELADYNDGEGATALIRKHARQLAAVIVEPILGAAGNIPGSAEFLRALRTESEAAGALLIFDEVKTSRCGPGGIQGEFGITPDLTTLGKYIGGGLPSGAFGGRKDIMDYYDPTRTNGFRHAGTFNNNVCSMAAGLAGLTRVFTPERAADFQKTQEAFRVELNASMAGRRVPVKFVGLGSMFTIHFSNGPIRTPKDIPSISRRLGQLFHIECLMRGVLVASRGDIFMGLPVTELHKNALRDAISSFVDCYGELLRRELPEAY
jgi:glutamate-1-semialdehyde 2,1-aminomutase